MITRHPILPDQQHTHTSDPEFIRNIEDGTKGYYRHIGVTPPWIGYLFKDGDQWIGTGGFKGRPVEERVELAYAVLPEMEGKGYGTIICAQLIEIAQSTDPGLRICTRTLPEKNASGRILLKNSFKKLRTVKDEEDGEVWEWQYLP